MYDSSGHWRVPRIEYNCGERFFYYPLQSESEEVFMQNINDAKYKKLYNKVKKLLNSNASEKNKVCLLSDSSSNKSTEQKKGCVPDKD